MADYIEKVPQEKFDMESYRTMPESSPSCKSIGCIIGHCTVLDDLKNIPRNYYGHIRFTEWSFDFTGIEIDSLKWKFLFSHEWRNSDNTPTGAAKRIRYFIEHGVPKNRYSVMHGREPLPY